MTPQSPSLHLTVYHTCEPFSSLTYVGYQSCAYIHIIIYQPMINNDLICRVTSKLTNYPLNFNEPKLLCTLRKKHWDFLSQSSKIRTSNENPLIVYCDHY